MTSHRPSRVKMPSRHGPLRGTASDRERQALRRLSYANASEITNLLSKPSVEISKWARGGQLNEIVLRRGSLQDLRALCALGAKFAGSKWNNSHTIADWKTEDVSQWLDLLFERGWDGMGGKPEPLLSVAEFHPVLVEKWSKLAPTAWHNRRNWLGGALNLTPTITPERVRAWFLIGGSHAGANKLALTDWFAQNKEPSIFIDVLSAMRECLTQDKQRRRTRGEPPFREWPWALTRSTAALAGKIEVMEWISQDLPPPNQQEVITWMANTSNPMAFMTAAQGMGWRVPHPKSEEACVLINAILIQQAQGKKDKPVATHTSQILMHLLDLDYRVNLSQQASEIVDQTNFPASIAASLQAAQLRNAQPVFQPPLRSASRPRL
jgi:hypothetical protein